MHKILTIIFALMRAYAFPSNNPVGHVINASNDAAKITAKRNAQSQAAERTKEMTGAGIPWNTLSDEEGGSEITGSHLAQLRGYQNPTSFYGSLQLDLEPGQLTLFDYSVFLGERQSTVTPILQTVCSLGLSDSNVVSFYLRPIVNQSAVGTEFLTCYPAVSAPAVVAHNLILESHFGNQIDAVFQTRTAFTELLPLIGDNGLTVEWTGQKLIVYRLQETADAEGMKELSDKTLRIAELLQLAAQEANLTLQQEIANKSLA